MNDSKRFYERLPVFTHFADVTRDNVYVDAPEDWVVVVTDIKGSTKAILENRYKDVNMLGASSIIAVLNSLKGAKIPYVFGGDGATLLIHESDLASVRSALQATQAMASARFKMELRVGSVPVRDLAALGGRVRVAKFQMAENAGLAMMRGGGLALAEKLIKGTDTGPRYEIKADDASATADFTGLSCRWNPVPAKKGEMLSLLVYAQGLPEEAFQTYERVIAEIDEVLGQESGRPVSYEKLEGAEKRFSFLNLISEYRARSFGHRLRKRLHVVAAILAQTLLTFITFAFRGKIGGFDSVKYVKSVATNSDFRKFDDMLRMILDCSPDERERLVQVLEAERANGKLAYGVHIATGALMTCMVFSLEDHVHFIDGDGGGYALAAKQLKEQLLESRAGGFKVRF